MRLETVVVIAIAAGAAIAGQADAPRAEIASTAVRASVYLPDADAGYYRGTRFDWAGAVASLSWQGHSYFGKWFDRYDPHLHDAITGPVEEFSSVGYDDAKVGEAFVRIGVGAVRKPEEPGYAQFKTYDLIDGGVRTTTRGPDWIEFRHVLGPVRGYGYDYRKRVRLTDHGLVLEHTLENTGTRAIASSVYEHNFYMLDNQPTGPDTTIRFPFDVAATGTLNGFIETRGREIAYLKVLQDKESLYTELKGYGATAADYDIRVENRATRAGVRQTGDRPLSKLVLWSPRSTVCPEAYVDIHAAPGETTTWRITYEFYETAAK
jgi:hypothetical protein